MAVSKILLYYRFTPIADPEAIRVWQRDLCELLGLRGRILISKDGINGTVGGELKAVKTYWRKMRAYAPFADTDFKWSEGSDLDSRGLSLDFPRLVVKVRDEIVSFGAPDELRVDEGGVRGGGTHLSPEAVNALVAERADDVVFFDGRNSFEAEIGKFKNAVVPDAATTRDLVSAIDSGQYDHLKDKPIVTYCTGGVRCEVLSSLMISRGFSEVYQIDGGIVRYGERFGNSGLWEGSLYVFDAREALTFGANAAVIGKCTGCGAPESRMVNCADTHCQSRVVQCGDCAEAGEPHCERAHAA